MYPRQGTAAEKRSEVFQRAVRDDRQVELAHCILQPHHPIVQKKTRGKRKIKTVEFLVLSWKCGTWKRRERSMRGTLIKRQCLGFTTIPPLQCAVMQWCIALHGFTKAFIPTLLHVPRFYSQLNAHWNTGEKVPHWALHNVERRTDERTYLF